MGHLQEWLGDDGLPLNEALGTSRESQATSQVDPELLSMTKAPEGFLGGFA